MPGESASKRRGCSGNLGVERTNCSTESRTERLAELDDEYGMLEDSDEAIAQVDAEVTAEARRLAHHLTIPAEPTEAPS